MKSHNRVRVCAAPIACAFVWFAAGCSGGHDKGSTLPTAPPTGGGSATTGVAPGSAPAPVPTPVPAATASGEASVDASAGPASSVVPLASASAGNAIELLKAHCKKGLAGEAPLEEWQKAQCQALMGPGPAPTPNK